MEVKQSGNTILTRWYPGGSFIRETAAGVTKDYTFIGGDAYSAPVVAITQNSTTTYYNLLRDHLGSITHVVNASNNTLLYEYSYDSWGRMRNISTWTDFAPGSEPSLFVAGRGFTGHEHLPWFNLINMNGRVYDPLVGQFLSPDNHVQSPYYTQSLNRYGYALNNPLIYNDPSGEDILIASLIFFVGQYAFCWLDNVINEHMSAKEAFQNTPIIIGVKGTIPYKENIPTANTYGGGSTGISDADLAKLGKTQSTIDGYYGVTLYEKAILGGGPGSSFFSTDLAAMDFGIRYNDNSISRALEFGTVFYSFEESELTYYSYVLPIVGFSSTVSIPLGSPFGTKFEGIGHTHGYGTGFEQFSDIDKSTPYYNYVCTPNGALYRYDARTQSITVITRDLPNMNNFQNYQWNEMDQGQLNFWKLLFWRLK